MAELTIFDHKTRIEQALLEALRLAFRARRTVADLAALAALDVTATPDSALAYVTSEARVYTLSLYSGVAHSSPAVIEPTAKPSNYGKARWLRSENTLNYGPNYNAPLKSRSAGYCKDVALFAGRGGTDEAMEQIMAVRPAILLRWAGDDPTPASQGYPGAHYANVLTFDVWAISECDRVGPWAVWGSPYAAESAIDPGMNVMVNQIRYLLAGSRLGMAADGVQWVEIGPAEVLQEDLASRLFIAAASIRVACRFHIPDEDLISPVVKVQPEMADTGSAEVFDPMNYIAQGYLAAVGPGLTRSWGAGIAIVGGVGVSSTPTDKTFADERDTYRDLKTDGTFAYSEVEIDQPAPALTAGAMRVGMTRASGGAIIADRILCSSSFVFRSLYQVVP